MINEQSHKTDFKCNLNRIIKDKCWSRKKLSKHGIDYNDQSNEIRIISYKAYNVCII